MRRALKVTLWVLGSLFLLVVVLFFATFVALSPSCLTPLVNKYASQYLNAAVYFDNVELTVWRNFPLVSVEFTGGRVISYALDRSGLDTLADVGRLALCVDVVKLLDSQVDIVCLELSDASASVRVDSCGRGSWEIYSAGQTTSTDTSSIAIQVGRVLLSGVNRVRYVDQKRGSDISADLGIIEAVRLGSTSYRVKLDVGIERALVDTVDYGRYLPLSLTGGAVIDYDALAVDSLLMRIVLGDASCLVSGGASLADSLINSQLRVDCSSLGLGRILELIPAVDSTNLAKIHTDLSFNFGATINGSYNFVLSDILPHIKLDICSNEGMIAVDGQYVRVDKFVFDASASLFPSVIDSNYFVVRRMELSGIGIDVKAKGRVVRFTDHYGVAGSLRGSVNLSTLCYWLPSNVQLQGVVRASVEANIARGHLTLATMGRARVDASVRFCDVRAADDSSKIFLNGQILATAKDDVFVVKMFFDTINVDDKRFMLAGAAKDLSFSTGIMADQQTVLAKDAIYPFGGVLRAKRFNLLGEDSLMIRARDMMWRFEIAPSERDRIVPVALSSITAWSLSFRQGLHRFSASKSKVTLDVEMINSQQERDLRRERRLDSLQGLYPDVMRSNLVAHNRKVNPPRRTTRVKDYSDLDLNPGSTVRDLLRRWRVQGKMVSKSVRISTPYLPLRTRLNNFDVEFSTDSLILRSLEGRVGRSDIRISGSVHNLRRALTARGVLRVEVSVRSDTLDFNQIIRAINAGSLAVDQLSGLDLSEHSDEHIERLIEQSVDTSQASMLVLVPRNLRLRADLKVANAYYGTLVMDSLTTQLRADKRVLQLRDFSAGSNVGQISLHALYTTLSKEKISTSLDLELRDVDISRLVDQLPSVDTLLPMLNSFEGVVDVSVAARARIDSAMDIIMPSVDAVARLKGKDLVLLDGKTFAEIAKMLHFKNKKRNLVDKMSVEVRVKDQMVEIYPFMLDIDRYRAAVSGKHALDMNFDYHISVIKSIIPFRLGIDVYGNLDDWKFKIGTARFKSEQLPSYTVQIDSARINLRQEIVNVFDRLTNEALTTDVRVDSIRVIKSDKKSNNVQNR